MKKLIVDNKKKIPTKELAEWFGIAYKTYCNQRKKRLEELKGFCDYEEVYGGVIVKKVYFDEYYKYQDDESRVLKVINDKYFNMDGQGTAYDELFWSYNKRESLGARRHRGKRICLGC